MQMMRSGAEWMRWSVAAEDLGLAGASLVGGPEGNGSRSAPRNLDYRDKAVDLSNEEPRAKEDAADHVAVWSYKGQRHSVC